MTDFPTTIFSPRAKENKAGVVYDAEKKTIPFAEDLINIDNEVVALEKHMQDKINRLMVIVAAGPDTLLELGDGLFTLIIPVGLNGYKITGAHAAFNVVEVAGNILIDIFNVTNDESIMTSKIQIDEDDRTSYDSADQPVINTAKNEVATGNQIRIDIDSTPTTAKGLQIFLTFFKSIS